MWTISRPKRRSLLALIMFAAVGLTSVAMADPNVPAKVKTIRISPRPTEDRGGQPTSPSKSSGVHLLTVRPKLPDENRDAAGRELSTTQGRSNASPNTDSHVVPTIPIRPAPAERRTASDPDWSGAQGIVSRSYDPHRIRTMTVRPEPGVINTPDNHFIPATPVSTQAPPQ